MFQFLPALILLLLQSQGYSTQATSDQSGKRLLSIGYCQHLSPPNQAVREVHRALLVRLLAGNSANSRLSRQLIDLINAIDQSPQPQSPTHQLFERSDAVEKVFADPPISLRFAPFSSNQRFRDGPSFI